MGFVISGMELLIIGILWEFLIIIAVLLVVLIIVIARKSFGSKAPEPAQEKLEHNKEMKGKTLEEYKKYYLAKKKKLDLALESSNEDSDGNPTKLFLEVQEKINELMLKKGYSLSEAVSVVAEDYNKLGIYLIVDPSGTGFKVSRTDPAQIGYNPKFAEKFYQSSQSTNAKESESNFCENCGKSLKPEAKFCGGCGTQRS